MKKIKVSATGSAPVQSVAGLAEPDISALKGLADPTKTAAKSKGLADPSKTAAKSKGLADPSKTASKSKGLAGPSKTAGVKKRTHSIPVKSCAGEHGGAWVDADRILNPNPPPANKPPVPPQNREQAGEKSGKGYNDSVRIHNRFSALEDSEMEVEASKPALLRSGSGSPPLDKHAGGFFLCTGIFADWTLTVRNYVC